MKRRLVYVVLSLLVSIGATIIAVAISSAVIAGSGRSPVDAANALYTGAFGSSNQVASTLSKTVPLMLAALGWIVAFSTKRVNIGLEGQMLAGGAAATLVALSLGGTPAPLHLATAVIGGLLGGAAWAGIAAWLWARRSVNEIIATLLLNLVAIQMISWLVHGPLQEPTHSFPRTDPIAESARWPHLLANTSLGFDLLVAVGLMLVVWAMLNRTVFGFRLRLTGANADAARLTGIRTVSTNVLALVLAGALAGLGGASVILSSETATMSENFSAGYGFAGIVVALLARNSPLGVLPAALLIAALRQGGGLMEAQVGVPASLVLVTQGLVILLVVAASFLFERFWSVRVDTKVRRPLRAEGATSSVVDG